MFCSDVCLPLCASLIRSLPQIKDEYTVVLTLTDDKLGDGQFITQSMLVLVEDINDNEPVFRPYESSLAVDENAPPKVLATLLATDQDEGPFGQVCLVIMVVVVISGSGSIGIDKSSSISSSNSSISSRSSNGNTIMR